MAHSDSSSIDTSMDDSFTALSNSQNEEYFKEFLRNDPEFIIGKVTYLSNMFPDADPEFLQSLVQESNGEDQKLYELMDLRLLTGEYPKIHKQYEKKEKERKILNYTTNFNVEKFIKQFPEPFEYFENPYKHGRRQPAVLNLLKQRYYDRPATEIEQAYSQNEFNLCLTVNYLNLVSAIKNSTPFKVETDDLSLLQEIAFINNKDLIKQEIVHREKQKIPEAEVSFTCQCCYSDDSKLTEAIYCDNNHSFCKRCIIQSANVAVSQRENFLKCLSGCNVEFSLSTLKRVLPEHLYNDLEAMKQKVEITAAKLENLVTCPFCPFAMELDEKIKIFKCRNPVCMIISCRLCKKENHLPLSCEDVKKKHSARLYYEEQLSQELIRVCNNCQKPFIKDGGCNAITCSCGKKMCYLCRKPIDGYNHFGGITGCRQ